MMMRVLLSILLLVLAGQAVAETKPRSLSSDPRIREYRFDPNTVYRLDVFMKFITSVHFGEGEEIESIQIGDSASWEVVRLSRADVLSVKPLIEGAYTNMTVLTDRRAYTFELRARSANVGSPQLNYRISFRYPDEDARRHAEVRARENRAKDFDYVAAGDQSLRPASVYDDGVATYFKFSPGAPRPAIFRVDPAGRESVVNVRATNDGFIVDSISERWTIRRGERELCVAHEDVIDTVPLLTGSTTTNSGDDR